MSPVYDPAPMRAWSMHNTRSAIPIMFDKDIGGLKENLITLGSAYGLSQNEAQAIFDDTANATKDYAQRVMALEKVPQATRQNLVQIIRQERKVVGV